MRYILGLILFSLTFLFANAIDFSQTDFIERSINFVIFVIILWLLLAKKAKAFFLARSERISNQLLEVQEKLKIAKNHKEQALRRLEEAKENATEILANAKREAYMIEQKIEEQSRRDIENMIKNTELLMDFEQKRMEKEVVDEVLEEVFSQSTLNTAEYVNIIEKKVV